MELEYIKTLIDTDPFVEVLEGGADYGGDEADYACEPWRDVTCGRGDTNKTGTVDDLLVTV